MPYDIHPAANIFPMIEGEAFRQLKADIKEHGQRDDILLFDGKILDGRNRLKACEELGIEPEFAEIEECPDPIAYVLSKNLHRRHLNESQRGMVAAHVKKLREPEAKKRKAAGQKSGGRGRKKESENLVVNLPPSLEGNGKARDEAAEALNVSGKTVSDASAVLDKGSAELIRAVESGEVSVSKAAKAARSAPKSEQMDAVKSTPKSKEKKSPLDQLRHWWAKASNAQQAIFRDEIMGDDA